MSTQQVGQQVRSARNAAAESVGGLLTIVEALQPLCASSTVSTLGSRSQRPRRVYGRPVTGAVAGETPDPAAQPTLPPTPTASTPEVPAESKKKKAPDAPESTSTKRGPRRVDLTGLPNQLAAVQKLLGTLDMSKLEQVLGVKGLERKLEVLQDALASRAGLVNTSLKQLSQALASVQQTLPLLSEIYKVLEAVDAGVADVAVKAGLYPSPEAFNQALGTPPAAP